jgi:Spy/CpxP family protein refolding chaperone
MTTITTRRLTAGRVRLLAFGAALATGLVLAPQAGAQSGEQQGRPDRGGMRGARMDPAQRIERRVSMMTERLSLSTEQATQVRQILTKESEQMRALFEKAQGGADRESLRPQMQSLRDSTEKQIEGVLTPQQLTSYRELREKMRQEREQRGGERRGPPPQKR